MSPKVSVIIRCFNEEKHIGKLLVGLTKQKMTDFEVILVDSGSTDDTLQIAERFQCKLVQIHPEEFSFGRALNLGCAQATGEFLIFASAHVYPVYDDWFDCLLKPFANPKIAAVYGKQRGAESSYYSEQQLFCSWYPERSVEIQDTPFCNNANIAIRRSLWLEHRYDEELTGLEDLHWANQLFLKGHRISYSAEAEIIHIHEERWRQVFNRFRREAIALKRIYPEQTMSLVSFARLFIGNTLSDFYHAVRERVLLDHVFDIPTFRFLQFWGAYKGFRQSGQVPARLKQTFYYPRSLQRLEHSGHDRQIRTKINYKTL